MKASMTYREVLGYAFRAIPPLLQMEKVDIVKGLIPLRRISRELEPHVNDFHAARDALLGETEGGDEVLAVVDPEERRKRFEELRAVDEAFDRAIRELLETRVEVEVERVSPRAFEQCERFTGVHLMEMGPLME